MYYSKFDLKKFHKLATYAIIKHDLPFHFIEYEDIRSLLSYICENVKLVSRNIIKIYMQKLYKKKITILSILNSF